MTNNSTDSEFDVSAWPPLPRLRGLFVTATDTGVGKTLIAGAIARSLRRCGIDVEVFKPAASGCRRTREGLVSCDGEFLAACAESARSLSEITPLRYASPVAPNVAAGREGKPIDLEAIFRQYRLFAKNAKNAENAKTVIVEGTGGLLCPISDDLWVIHLAKMMNLPLVIVSRAGLGTINHTLLTLHAARQAGLKVAGVIVNRYPVEAQAGKAFSTGLGAGPPEAGDLSIVTNPAQIAQRGHVEVLAIVPDEPANSVENATVGPDTQFAIDQVNWQNIVDWSG